MNSILTVLPFHKADQASALELINWINELDTHIPVPRHSLLLAADAGVSRADVLIMAETARKTFLNVHGIQINVPPTSQGWIKGSDWMFLKVCEHVQKNMKCPFLWMEPDCVPLKPLWLDSINDAYEQTPYRYLGAIVRQKDQPDLPAAHMTGCGVYPNDAYDYFSTVPEVTQGAQAWDMAGAAHVVPACKDSPLFQSYWGQIDLAPEFVKARTPESPKNHIAFGWLRPEAVFFHRDKTHSLMALVREKLRTPPVETTVLETPPNEPEKVSEAKPAESEFQTA